MKKIILTVLCLFVLSSIGFASPLMDYSKGKAAIDLTYRPSLDVKDEAGTFDGKAYDWGFTYGIGNKMALQYKQFNPETDSYDGIKHKIKSEEFNVLYKLDKNVSAFTGIVRYQHYFTNINSITSGQDYKNKWQVGLVGSTNVWKKTDAYGVAALGNDYRNWEIGLSYAIAKDIDFNLSYRDAKFKDNSADITTKGYGFGVTYKF